MGVGSRRLGGATPANLAEMREWIGWRVDDANGAAIGRLHDVIPDANGRPRWLVINELRFGAGRRFVAPAREASGSRDRVWLPLDRDYVRGSANLGHPLRSVQAERRLLAHYGLEPAVVERRAG